MENNEGIPTDGDGLKAKLEDATKAKPGVEVELVVVQDSVPTDTKSMLTQDNQPEWVARIVKRWALEESEVQPPRLQFRNWVPELPLTLTYLGHRGGGPSVYIPPSVHQRAPKNLFPAGGCASASQGCLGASRRTSSLPAAMAGHEKQPSAGRWWGMVMA